MVPRPSLKDFLDGYAGPGAFYSEAPGKTVQCRACAHRCRLKPGQRGICQVRFNREGRLLAPMDYVAGLAADPIEKKPFYHVLPGSLALSFGMLGCNFKCDFCQNWVSSQALKDPASEGAGRTVRKTAARDLVQAALDSGCPVVTSTYNEPLITAEWAERVFGFAHTKGLLTSFVSNGHATPEVLKALRPSLDLLKIDLKCFNESTYRKIMGGKLSAVLESIEQALALGYWVEVVTLVVPGMNDSGKELGDIARFLVNLSKDIPWHVTAFHPQYRMDDRPWTEPETLKRAVAAGREAGLRFVYSGNLPGEAGDTESTKCPSCGGLLVERKGYRVARMRVTEGGACPDCGASIPGVWKRP